MSVENWFQEWHPPAEFFQSFHTPFHSHNFTANINIVSDYMPAPPYRKNPKVSNFLPLFLSFNLIKQPPHEKHEQHTPVFDPVPLETTGPFKTWYHWNVLDFAYPTEEDRERAIENEDFIPRHNLPLGIETHGHRLFLAMPKWKPGVPATLAVLPKIPREPSPRLVPYPNWEWHNDESCEGITSVFRMQADECNRLWVLDSGQIDVTIKPRQVCPPKILIFDLKTDELITKYVFPDEFIKEDGLYSNILIDIREDDCDNAYAYVTDVWRYGLVIFSLEDMSGWRLTDHLFYPEPLAARYNVHHLEFEWTDGLFGLALSPNNGRFDERLLYFHPMSSFREFYVKTSILRNETHEEIKRPFKVMGQSRGASGHVSASGMDRNGIMFYNLVTKDAIGCWDSRKPYKRDNLGIVAKSSKTLVFPNDLRVDKEKRQSIWIITNKLPFYLYESLDEDEINFRVLSAYTDEAIKGNICDPHRYNKDTFEEFRGDEDCY